MTEPQSNSAPPAQEAPAQEAAPAEQTAGAEHSKGDVQEIEGDFPGGLKDLNTSRKDVQDALIRAFQAWIEIADFDGFRIDTLKHVEPEFFERFALSVAF